MNKLPEIFLFLLCISLAGCKKEHAPEEPVILTSFVAIKLTGGIPAGQRDSVVLTYENDKVVSIKKYEKYNTNDIRIAPVYHLKYEGNALTCDCPDAFLQFSEGLAITNDAGGNIKTFKSGKQEIRFRYNLKGQLSGTIVPGNTTFEDYLYDKDDNLAEVYSTKQEKVYTYGEHANPFLNLSLQVKVFLSLITQLPAGNHFNTVSKKAPVSLALPPQKYEFSYTPKLNKRGLLEEVKSQVISNGSKQDYALLKFYYR